MTPALHPPERRWRALLRASQAWARTAAALAAAVAAVTALATDAPLPAFAASPVALGGAGVVAALLLASAAAALLRPRGALAACAARLLVRAGFALALGGVAASFAWREVRVLQLGEGQSLDERESDGLPPFTLEAVRVAPEGSNALLSKTVEAQLARREAPGEEPTRVGLFPPRWVGAWRLSVLRFGYAPGLRWEEGGRVQLDGYVMLGTLAHSQDESTLVTWSPEPNLMMGVGFFPPRIEELVPGATPGARLFVRIERARLAGIERDLAREDAWRWLADGPPQDATVRVELLHGRERVCDTRLHPGEEASCAGARVRLNTDLPFWVEILAVRDPWLPVAVAGMVLLVAGALTRVAAAKREGAPPGA